MARLCLLLAIIISLSACSSSETTFDNASGGKSSEAELKQRSTNNYLAYEHSVTVDTTEESISSLYQNIINTCSEERTKNCTILNSNIDSGKFISAKIKLRISPDGVDDIIAIATKEGKVTNQSTSVEDLATDIIDGAKRIDMLKSYREKLIALEKKASDDIESLIKVSSELSAVQSQLEAAEGSKAHLVERVNLDIVNITLVVEASRSFWRPIIESLDEFGNHLSEGIAEAITGIAYLTPWFIVLLGFVYILRFLWKRSKFSSV